MISWGARESFVVCGAVMCRSAVVRRCSRGLDRRSWSRPDFVEIQRLLLAAVLRVLGILIFVTSGHGPRLPARVSGGALCVLLRRKEQIRISTESEVR